MAHHGIETSRIFKPLRGRLAFELDADVETRRGRGLNQGKLFRSPQADVRFLGRDIDIIAKILDGRDQRIVNRAQLCLGAAVLGVHEVIGARSVVSLWTQVIVRDHVGVAVTDRVLIFEKLDNLAVLGRLACR